MDDESLRIQQRGLITEVLRNSGAAQEQAHNATMEAIAARSKASAAQRAARISDSGSLHLTELKKKQEELERAQATIVAEKQANAELHQKVDKLIASLAERDEIIVDWMHNNEAFKRLARQYGKELNKTNEQRQNDLDQHVLDIAEEQPEDRVP